MNLRFLLPHKFKFVGIVLFIIGMIGAYLRFYLGIKPTVLNVSVFAFYSSFLDTKTFSVITNNISDEIIGLLLSLGLIFINFSKETFEDEIVNSLRLRSFYYSVLTNTIIIIFSILFIYGFAFVNVFIINLFSQLILYQLFFRLSLILNYKKNSNE
jgi:hypothetical protein